LNEIGNLQEDDRGILYWQSLGRMTGYVLLAISRRMTVYVILVISGQMRVHAKLTNSRRMTFYILYISLAFCTQG
jgi:hypothetical protein